MLWQKLAFSNGFRDFSPDTVSLLQEIPTSPFRVKVDPSYDASKVKAEGPGLSKAGKRVCKELTLEAVGTVGPGPEVTCLPYSRHPVWASVQQRLRLQLSFWCG